MAIADVMQRRSRHQIRPQRRLHSESCAGGLLSRRKQMRPPIFLEHGQQILEVLDELMPTLARPVAHNARPD